MQLLVDSIEREFAADLCARIWCGHIIKSNFSEVSIRTHWKYFFPKEISQLFCDEYRTDFFKYRAIHAPLRSWLFDKINDKRDPLNLDKCRLRINYPKIRRTISEKYVCFIPCLAERWNEESLTAGGRSSPFNHWLEYKAIANRKGYKVIGLGSLRYTGLDKVNYETLVDENLWIGYLGCSPELYLWEQIQIMYHAELTLGMGGGGLIAPCFTLRGISVDEFWEKHFGRTRLEETEWCDALYSFSREDTRQRKIDLTYQYIIDKLECRL